MAASVVEAFWSGITRYWWIFALIFISEIVGLELTSSKHGGILEICHGSGSGGRMFVQFIRDMCKEYNPIFPPVNPKQAYERLEGIGYSLGEKRV